MGRWSLRVMSSCLLLALGCGDDGDDGGEEKPLVTALTAATYNMGLLDSVGAVPQRAGLTIDATAKLDAEVLCVQEAWEQQHWDALVAASPQRPHVQRLAADPGAVGQCNADQFNPLQICAQQACAQTGELVSCTTTNCASQVAALDAGCTSCLLANSGSGNFDTIRNACVGSGATGAAGRSYVSGGSYGIGMLSSRAFAATDQKLLDASIVRRAILYGRIDDPNLGSVHVFCTHLSAIQSGLKYDGMYGDWDGENAKHVEQLIEFVTTKAGANGKVLVLGDLNTGPAAAGISPSVPANYAKFAPAGFVDPYLNGPLPKCTFCTDNPLVVATDTGAGAMLDHVLTRNLAGKVTVARQLDTLVDIDVPQQTEKRRVGLSDHYALRAVVAR